MCRVHQWRRTGREAQGEGKAEMTGDAALDTTKPWEAVGVSRATWYRLNPKPKTESQGAMKPWEAEGLGAVLI
jgi:hypothetical protein